MAVVPLRELLGSLTAHLVEAEREAANATIAFLREVGFEGGRRENRNENDWGTVRLVHFAFSAPDQMGDPAPRRIQVPLLSLLPVPLQQIANAEYELFFRVDDLKPG